VDITTALQWGALVNHAVLVGSLAFLALAGACPVWLVLQYLRVRGVGRARDRVLLERALPPDAQLPDVLVQLPIFNEPLVVRRVIEAAAGLEWPREKLHIQVLDDSTDESTGIARDAAACQRARGLDVEVLHRAKRADYKAGALREGLWHSSCDYVALFDADYVPAPDFLRRSMTVLLADSGLAFVQARLDWLNPGRSALTRAQQVVMDGHFAVDFPTKSWSGLVMHFCGTGGLWRRSAIEDAGGWSADALAEDVDLAYRAQFRGWRALFLVDVAVPGELPETFRSWRAQQARWARGMSHITRKYWRSSWRSQLSLAQKIAYSANLLVGIFGAVVVLALISGGIDLLTGVGPTAASATLGAFAILEAGAALTVTLVLGQSVLRGVGPARSIPSVLAALGFYLYAHARAAVEILRGLNGTPPVWVRTAKTGVVTVDDSHVTRRIE
jgi:cellulose synthase/poly-beta-1,6-N-acetylglucosamine synthase-like glycosyltransferase